MKEIITKEELVKLFSAKLSVAEGWLQGRLTQSDVSFFLDIMSLL